MADITPNDLLQPHTGFHIRNRYLSRIGAPVSKNYFSIFIKISLNTSLNRKFNYNFYAQNKFK